MSQPKWKMTFGTDYSSIFVDETGVYDPEMVLTQEVDDSDEKFVVYRFPLERFKVVTKGGKKYLVGIKWDKTWPHPIPRYEPWFLKGLDGVARSVGRTPKDIIGDLVSADPHRRSRAYEDIGGYHGFANFDHEPRVMGNAGMSAALRG